ncbi:hypothetical protein EEB11_03230 [Pseudotabrizicola sediminis]|uniref:Uncharacterized protein n=1 Tax=Pseudotabrizicola sediminis TaxID=2486418 RepID=A0ABY2KSL3_9RHOB|nr:hypothetical protein [Pseudotabrizicola sediminis]TGD44607.1 hypothetical protein EEB11_03230 [Pseudotabrizicola sediminis]
MRVLLLLFTLLTGQAQAQALGVTVRTGDHGAFTRIVLTFPARVSWVLGRTSGGYGLRVAGPRLNYNLSSVFDLITKDRLRTIGVDPANGDLLFGVDCPCHAIPFELGSRFLVIDIRDGAPPPNSSFERRLVDGTLASPIRPSVPIRPRSNGGFTATYDWLDRPTPVQRSAPTPPAEPEIAGLDSDLRLQDFRTMLIEEMGRGATQGVVEMQPRQRLADPATDSAISPQPDNARAAVIELPGIGITSGPDSPPDLMVQGSNCPAPAEVDVGAWAATEEAADELSRARAALLSEFDVPDRDSVVQAVNTHLHFGFGAEARLMLSSFMPAGQDTALRTGLSYLLDGDLPPDNPFLSMQSCDSAAALWALLAAPEGEVLPYVNGTSISRTFLALPRHLRTMLGPEVAKRLLRSGDGANAQVVTQSFARAAPQGDPTIDLLSADQALIGGAPAEAEAALPTGATGETAMAALFTLVEARFQQRKPIEGRDILALEAFSFEHGNGPLRPRLDRALAHGAALGGDFTAAFDHALNSPALEQDVWMLMGDVGAESQLLLHAVGLDPIRRDSLPLAIRSKLAERLLDAGLPNIAANWTQKGDLDDSLTARIALANGDARGALQALAANLPNADADLLAASFAALGDFESAANRLEGSGNIAEAQRLQRWSGTWPSPADGADDPSNPADTGASGLAATDPWSAVAGLIDPDQAIATSPPLLAGQTQLNQSAATRQAIADLLATAPVDAAP